MVAAQVTFRRLFFAVALLALAGLACNAPLVGPSPTATNGIELTPAGPTQTLAAPETLPAALATTTPREGDQGAQPTFTSIALPTLRPSATPSLTPRVAATSTVRPPGATATSASGTAPSAGPLRVEYQIDWRLSPSDAMVSIATVTIRATGGRGQYRYYRDDAEVAGPVFEYQWSSCKGNPGTLRVTSADGQSWSEVYFSHPPCPTPTPTGSP
jgi:hypothetical protein